MSQTELYSAGDPIDQSLLPAATIYGSQTGGPLAWSGPGLVIAANTLVSYQSSTYLCTTPHTTGASFDSSKFEPVGGPNGTWAASSPLLTSLRPATDLLMSVFDTNPASTDHTAAFQSALAAAAAIIASGVAKVRILLDSRQKYTLGGAVTAGSNGQWAQVPIPYSATVQGTIELVGMPQDNDFRYISLGASGTVIESTLSSAPTFTSSVGIASIFGGPASYCSGHSPSSFSHIRFATRDLTIRSAAPVICGIDAGWLHGFAFNGCLSFDTDFVSNIGPTFPIGSLTPCTAPQAIPIIFPFTDDWYGTYGDRLVVSNWLCGPVLGEYLDCRSVTVFACPGAALNVDTAVQVSKIGLLTDWDNAYGIAATNPASGATPVAPSSPFAGSGVSGLLASPIDIGRWTIQRSGPAVPSALDRVSDLLDSNNLIPIDAKVSQNQGGTGGVIVGGLTLIGTGGSASGQLDHARILDALRTPGTHTPSMPTSGTAIRNPNARSCLVTVSNGSSANVTAVTVQGVAQPTGVVAVPANGIIAISWTGAGTPTWNWMVL